MPLSINPVRSDPSIQKDPRNGFDKDMDRILKALQIANSGFDIAVDYQTFQKYRQERANLPSPELAQRRHEADVNLVDSETALNLAKARGVGSEDLNQMERDFRNQWLHNPQTQRMQVVNDSYRKMAGLAKSIPSPAGDISIVYGYMKLLDPTSAVLQGEQATVLNAASIPDRLRNIYNNLLLGQRLTKTQRFDIYRRSEGIYSAHVTNQKTFDSEFKRLAIEKGIDPNRVVLDFKFDLPEGENKISRFEPTPTISDDRIFDDTKPFPMHPRKKKRKKLKRSDFLFKKDDEEVQILQDELNIGMEESRKMLNKTMNDLLDEKERKRKLPRLFYETILDILMKKPPPTDK